MSSVHRCRPAGRLLFCALLIAACAGWERAPRWRTCKGCLWKENAANDGDSFHVKAGRTAYLFRLYFVDCPETDALIPERVKEQATYFGITEAEAMRAGEEAREFTRQFLKQGFTVYTKKQGARGRSEKKRYFAIVKAGGADLGEELVKRGLARVYGEGTALPDGREEQAEWRRLHAEEKKARGLRLGAWRNSQSMKMRPGPGAGRQVQ